MEQLADDIQSLPDDQAVATLALVLELQGQVLDPFAWRQTEPRLREALAQPEVTELATPEPTATSGELARIALQYLAKRDARTRLLVERAIVVRASHERFDPATLAIGALVLMAFHAEIDLERDPVKGWSFHFHSNPLKDSTIGRLLGQLMGVYLNRKQ